MKDMVNDSTPLYRGSIISTSTSEAVERFFGQKLCQFRVILISARLVLSQRYIGKLPNFQKIGLSFLIVTKCLKRIF